MARLKPRVKEEIKIQRVQTHIFLDCNTCSLAGWVVASDNFLNLETLAVVGETALKFLVFPVCAGVRCMVEYWDRECTAVL